MVEDQLSPFDILPKAIITSSILPFTSSDDWLTLRAASRSCYKVVHGTNDVSHSFCNLCQANSDSNRVDGHEVLDSNESIDSDRLWNLALIRDYRFRTSDIDSNYIKQSIHSLVNENESFLSTKNAFTAKTSFMSWKHWRKIEARRNQGQRCTNPCRQLVGPYYLRAASLWKKIEHWCDDETLSCGLGEEIKGSLVPGRNMLEVHDFQEHHVITALLAVYSFYSAQAKPRIGASVNGLFGGYSAYNFGCMMHWCQWDVSVTNGLDFDPRGNSLLITLDSMLVLQKEIFLDMESGQLFNVDRDTNERLLATPIAKVGDANSTDARNDIASDIEICAESSLLRWFEELSKRLTNGYYSVDHLSPKFESLSILQYPSVSDLPIVSRAVTRGVEVVASSVYHPGSGTGSPLFVYSIRLRLLTREDGDEYESPEQRGFTTCQLHSRHWMITKQNSTSRNADGTTVEEVRGEGVVGEYPLLMEGRYQNYSTDARGGIFEIGGVQSGIFRYQSCTDYLTEIFEGYLHFVPGSLKNPQGEPFRVRVAPFKLDSDPDYYY